mmetsp:Transcript_7340/g.17642  ORF Transcript_7340/g.17642 Transcript_7340/m.17642 type:complete len:310 (+) Transcript_7340:105-1034(+)
MGSKKHGSKRKQRHSDDERSSEEQNSSSDSSEDAKRSRSKKSKKERHKEKKKKSSHRDKQKLKEAKDFLKAHLGEESRKFHKKKMVPVDDSVEIKEISNDDYFSRNPEFCKWLKERKGLLFNEMTSPETHALFPEFVAEWNGRKLSKEFYDGSVGPGVARTSYNWGISTSDRLERERDEREASHQALRRDRKAWAAGQKELLDELLPRATGREARVEKAAARREEARQREVSPEMNRLIGGGDVMGGDDSFEAARAREQRRQQARQQRQAARDEERAARSAAAAANEESRMAAFRELVSKGPISIPKRQ